MTIAVARDATGITIIVDDNGPGIAADKRERVFDPFYSTKSDLQGVGLGLFVAEGLVRSAGGRIGVSDAPGGGARFTLVLPESTALALDSRVEGSAAETAAASAEAHDASAR